VITLYAQIYAVMLVLGVLTWILSLIKKDVSIVDSIWSLFFLFGSLTAYFYLDQPSFAHTLLILLVTIWAVRLSAYITRRNLGEDEDKRYQDIRERYSPNFKFKSLFIIFIFQATLAAIIALPLVYTLSQAAEINLIYGAGVFLWLIGFIFEAVGDAQLAAFKRNNSKEGAVMDKGLWRYTRHPNYFGECCLWWGYYLIALSAGGWWTIISPVIMTWLLLRFSGVALLEKDIVERRPAYRDYIQRTSAFFPMPVKKNSSEWAEN